MMLTAKKNLVSFIVQCYILIYKESKSVPPKGILSDVKDYYLLSLEPADVAKSKLSVNIVESKVLGGQKGVVLDPFFNLSLRKSEFLKCRTAIDVQGSLNLEHKMPINMNENNFEEVKTVVKAPCDITINASRNNFKKVETVFEIIIPDDDLDSLGLPINTPQELLRDAAEIINNNRDLDSKSLVQIISKSELGLWLAQFANMVTISTPLIAYLSKI